MTTRPVVCFVSGSHPDVPCGVGDYTARLSEALAEMGARVSVLTTRDERLRDGVGYRVIPVVSDWSIRRVPRLLREISRTGADVVNVQYPAIGYRRGLGPALLLVALHFTAAGRSIVLTLHELRRFHWTQRVLMRLAAAFAGLVVVVDATQTGLAFGLPLVSRPTVVEIPVGTNVRPLDLNLAGAAPRGTRREAGELVVGTWGFLAPDKGIDDLIAAFVRVVSNRPARLVFAGDLGPEAAYVDHVRRSIDAAGIRPMVSFTGWLPERDLSRVLLSFDVCALPFTRGLQASRGSYRTAIAHGVYTVTTSFDRFGYDPATNTSFVPPRDQFALAKAILDVHARTGVPGTVPTWAEIAARYLDAYASVR